MNDKDQLDGRKVTILKAIIKTYLETGEPVGSRTISKYTDLNLSSATIRNEMSDLEELGYIVQPHTSAGRIPSDKGYRFYVDQIMQEKEEEFTEIKDLMLKRVGRITVFPARAGLPSYPWTISSILNRISGLSTSPPDRATIPLPDGSVPSRSRRKAMAFSGSIRALS